MTKLKAIEPPKNGSMWRHHSGRLYEVLFMTNQGEEPNWAYPPTVVYRGVENSKLWSGPLHDWYRRMKPVEGEGDVHEH